MRALRVAVVGAGRFGREHLAVFAAMPDVEIVAVRDADPARAENVAREFGIDPHSDAQPDAVSIVVPAHLRGDLVTEALASGAAVFIEKPLALTAGEADALVAASSGRVAMVGHVLRFAEPYLSLASADLGAIRQGVVSRIRPADHATDYPLDDVIGLTMIHDLDAMGWLSGSRPVSVAARGERTADGRWRHCQAEVTLASGALWSLEASWTGTEADYRDTARIVGDAGEASLVIGPDLAPEVYAGALADELRHFVDHARAGTRSPRLRMTDAALAVRLADAVRDSLEHQGARRDLAE